jgi:hypothetical protein
MKVDRQSRIEAVRRLFYAKDLTQWAGRQHLLADAVKYLAEAEQRSISFLEVGIYSGELSKIFMESGIFNYIDDYTGVDITLERVPTDQFDYDKCLYVELDSRAWWSGLPSDEKWDIIFVDGDHTEEAAYHDMQEAKRHVSDCGFIFAHDIETQIDAPKMGADTAFDICVDHKDEFRYIRLPFHNEGMGLIFKR